MSEEIKNIPSEFVENKIREIINTELKPIYYELRRIATQRNLTPLSDVKALVKAPSVKEENGNKTFVLLTTQQPFENSHRLLIHRRSAPTQPTPVGEDKEHPFDLFLIVDGPNGIGSINLIQEKTFEKAIIDEIVRQVSLLSFEDNGACFLSFLKDDEKSKQEGS